MLYRVYRRCTKNTIFRLKKEGRIKKILPFLFGNLSFFSYVYNMKEIEKDWTCGLGDRYIQQIIRRKMIQKVKPSKKVYSRKKFNKNLEISA